MRSNGGRPRTFPAGIVPLAVERRDRTGESWAQIARDLKVPLGTLQARVSDYRRGVGAYKTPAPAPDERGSDTRTFSPRDEGVS
jgi:hypothetical protein